MPKRKKKNRTKRETKLNNSTGPTSVTDDTGLSSENSPEKKCDRSTIEMGIEMQKVYNTSNSLLGTFGLLTAQKPEMKKIKVEPEEVNSPLICSLQSDGESEPVACSVSKNDSRLGKQELRVVIKDIFNFVNSSGEKECEDVMKEVERKTPDVNEKLLIIGEFSVENDSEDVLDIINKNNETNIPLSGEKRGNLNEINLKITGENLLFNDSESLSNTPNNEVEQEESNANVSVPNLNELLVDEDLSSYGSKVIVQKDPLANDDSVCNGNLYSKKDKCDLENENGITLCEESDTNKLAKVNEISLCEGSSTNQKKIVNMTKVCEKSNTNEVENVNESKLFEESDSSKMVAIAKEGLVEANNFEFSNNVMTIKQEKSDDYESCLRNEWTCVKKEDKENVIQNTSLELKENKTGGYEYQANVNQNALEGLSKPVNDNVDFELNNLNFVSNGIKKEQNGNLCYVYEEHVQSDYEIFLHNENGWMDVEKSKTEDDIAILKEVCKICKSICKEFCSHFPLTVE